jgi:hypothetical protein
MYLMKIVFDRYNLWVFRIYDVIKSSRLQVGDGLSPLAICVTSVHYNLPVIQEAEATSGSCHAIQ